MTKLRRVSAMGLVIFTAVSLVLELVAVYEVWHLRQVLNDQLATSAALAQATLSTSDQTLSVLDQQLQSVSSLTTSAESAAQTSVTTIDATHRSLQAATGILRNDLPTTLSTVHAAVASAESAAALADNVLSALSFIPGFQASYHPQVPLHVALGNVAQSLDQLPNLTKQLADNLDSADATLPTARTDVSNVADTLKQSPVEADQMRALVEQYRQEVADLETQIQALQTAANLGMTWIAIAVTFLTIWLAIVQVAVLVILRTWLRSGPPR